MTKRVRVMNGDSASYQVVVQVWDKGYPEGSPDKLAFERTLYNPGDITLDDVYITSTRYLVVKEA